MLRQDSKTSINPEFQSGSAAPPGAAYRDGARVGHPDIQRELDRLEEMILDAPRIPLTRRTMIDEEQLLDQLDLVRVSLPEAFQEAQEIVRQKDEIFLQAEQYAQEIIEAAERRAAQIMNESGVMRQADLEAQQLRQRVQQECDAVQQQTIAEIERTRLQAQQDLEEMRRMAMEECEEIQIGADSYADRVLRDMESHVSDIMRIVRNGRQQLQINQPENQRPPMGNPNPGRPGQPGKGGGR
jgi:cell division septum initiation protein DivIVA